MSGHKQSMHTNINLRFPWNNWLQERSSLLQKDWWGLLKRMKQVDALEEVWFDIAILKKTKSSAFDLDFD